MTERSIAYISDYGFIYSPFPNTVSFCYNKISVMLSYYQITVEKGFFTVKCNYSNDFTLFITSLLERSQLDLDSRSEITLELILAKLTLAIEFSAEGIPLALEFATGFLRMNVLLRLNLIVMNTDQQIRMQLKAEIDLQSSYQQILMMNTQLEQMQSVLPTIACLTSQISELGMYIDEIAIKMNELASIKDSTLQTTESNIIKKVKDLESKNQINSLISEQNAEKIIQLEIQVAEHRQQFIDLGTFDTTNIEMRKNLTTKSQNKCKSKIKIKANSKVNRVSDQVVIDLLSIESKTSHRHLPLKLNKNEKLQFEQHQATEKCRDTNKVMINSDQPGHFSNIDENLSTNLIQKSYKTHRTAMISCAYLSDSEYAVGCSDGSLHIRDSSTHDIKYLLPHDHSNWINSIILVQDKLVSGSDDKTIIVWDLIAKQSISKINNSISVYALVHIREHIIASGGGWPDYLIKIWNINNSSLLHSLKSHANNVSGLIMYNQFTLLSVGWDKSIILWSIHSNITESKQNRSICTDTQITSCLDLNYSILAVGTMNGPIDIWNIETSQLIKSLREHSQSVKKILRLSLNLIVSCSSDKSIRIWDLEAKTQKQVLEQHTDRVFGIVKLNKFQLISISEDRTLRLWEIKHLKELVIIN